MGEKQGPQQSKVDLWGNDGAIAFDTALTAIHAFAQVTGCEPGRDVFLHIIGQHNALIFHEAAKRRATGEDSPANEGEGAS